MRIFNTYQGLDMDIEVGTHGHIHETDIYLPVVKYSSTSMDEVHYYIYSGIALRKGTFEQSLAGTYGDSALLPDSVVEYVTYESFPNVVTLLHEVADGTEFLDMVGKYDSNTETLYVGLASSLQGVDGYELLPVCQDDFEVMNTTDTLVAYNNDGSIGFRRAFYIECLSHYPQTYMTATRLLLANGIQLEFLTVMRKAKTYEELCRAIESQYELDSQSYRLQVASMPIAFASEDISKIHNFGRVEKYHAIVDLQTNAVHLRTFRDINPIFTQIKPEIPAISSKHRLYPVYEF